MLARLVDATSQIVIGNLIYFLFPSSQVVESVLLKVMEEVQQRLSLHNEMVRDSGLIVMLFSLE